MCTEYTTKDIERFYAKVSKTPTETGCLEWMGYHNRLGYGYFKVGKKNIRAHRSAWEIVNGPIPAGLVIRHMCHNPLCCNPAHLEIGSQSDNVRDMMNGGRWHNAPNTTAPYVKPVRPTANRVKRVRPVKPVEERFYAKVSKTPNETGCLDWLGGLRNGYGHFNTRGQYFYAHRLAWELVNGPIPPGMCACHVCDRHICCNPAHIFIGSKADNTRDMIAKGRAVHNGNCRGEAVGTSKLTAAQVLEIRSPQYEDWAPIDIAAKFGVTNSCVCMILRRQSWAHLDSSGDAPIVDRKIEGEPKKFAKLTEAKVLEIRSGRFDGWTHLEIADHFGVSRSVISNVLNRKAWTHI